MRERQRTRSEIGKIKNYKFLVIFQLDLNVVFKCLILNYYVNSTQEQNKDIISNSEEIDVIALNKLINKIWEEENLENNKEKAIRQLKSKHILNPVNVNSNIQVELPSHPPVAPKSEKNVFDKNKISDSYTLHHPPEIPHLNSIGKETIGNSRLAIINELKEKFKKRELQSL